MNTPLNSAGDPEDLHAHEAAPAPDGRVPSSTGRPNITIKSPGPEMFDPHESECESPAAQAGVRRDEDIFPTIDRDRRNEADSSDR